MPTLSPLKILLDLADQNRLTSDDFTRRLSAVKVRKAEPTVTPQKLPDGGGLTLYIPPTGAKVWRYRYRLGGKEQTLTIGAFPEVTLENARNAHRAARWLVARGLHPSDYAKDEAKRRSERDRAADEHLFRAVAERWMNATASSLAPRTVKHRRAMLEKHVLKPLGDKAVSEISRNELRILLVELDEKAAVTAHHCRGYIRQIFEYAEDLELVDANPTPRARVLVNASKRSAVPRKSLPVARLGEFLKTIDDAPATSLETKAALRLLLMTWSRTSEVTGARWEEFDLSAGEWRIPPARMKGKEEHRVFLSAQAVELLRGLGPKVEGPVFPNRRKPSESMNRMTLTNWRKRWGFAGVMEVHGLRAMASTWANEKGSYRPDVIEVALAHKEADRVRAAYNRAEFVGELKKLWQDWADFCDGKLKEHIAKSDTSLRQAA
jgi:integrase